MGRVSHILETIKDAVFPRFCVRCKKEGTLLCDACHVDWRPRAPKAVCFACDRPSAFGATCQDCRTRTLPDGLVSSFSYADPIARALIQSWKYHFDESAWEHLQQKVACGDEGLRSMLAFFRMQAIIPIPLHGRRVCERGFDQAESMAAALRETYSVPTRFLLSRVSATGRQADRTTSERKEAMRHNPFRSSGIGEVPKRVVLVDDVWTTGSTAIAATETLKQAGVETVWVYTLARG